MFEKYTEKARRVIFFSRYETSELGGRAIEPEHILLGLLREDLDLFRRLLPEGTDLVAAANAVRSAVEAAHPKGEKLSASVDMPLSASSKLVLLGAANESQKMGHYHIGTEHLLVALLRDDQSLASELLRTRGLKLEEVEPQISGGSATPRSRQSEPPVVRLRTQLNALVEVLVRRGVFTREEFVEELEGRYILHDLHATLLSLLGLLSRKGVLTENDTREIMGLMQ
jgi:ATP-dependent Clp protease ATP-binding subunit ClpA